MSTTRALLLLSLTATAPEASEPAPTRVSIPMRDGVELAGWLLRPETRTPSPVLVYRTPYGAETAVDAYSIFRAAPARGYAILAVDVRGRYGSAGEFDPYRQEGRDGYDTIEWAAAQPWSNGRVGSIGLSYPGAVQWMAAVETPPHLLAMVPAMTFSRPTNFWYNGGLTDLSWPPWIWVNIAPDVRAKRGLAGPRTVAEGRASWPELFRSIEHRLPLSDVPELRDVAPWYFEWLSHPPDDPWWSWADLTTKYQRVAAAVLNLSGWHDDPYGPEGALTNHLGLVRSRAGASDPRSELILGPWVHGIAGMTDRTAQAASGERVFGTAAGIDYDAEILRFMDRHLREERSNAPATPRVRVFVMGENAWRTSDVWPLEGTRLVSWYLSATGEGPRHRLGRAAPRHEAAVALRSDPGHPVVDPYAGRSGAHDYRALAERPDVLVFESEPLAEPLTVVGAIEAEIFLSVDAPDTDLFVKLFDVAPDGTAWSLMSPGLDGMRASYRDGRRSLLEPDRVYRLTLPDLLTGNRFDRGHRIRIVITPSFMPHYGVNLHTGELETRSAEWRTATLRVRTGGAHPSRIVLPVVP
ncbi:MAG: CocE/NonD family hydrolase [Gemmatimonadales bacterium]